MRSGIAIVSQTPIRHAHLQGSSVHPSIDYALCINALHSWKHQHYNIYTFQPLASPFMTRSYHLLRSGSAQWRGLKIGNHRYTLAWHPKLATPANLYSQVIPMDDLTYCCLQDRFAQLSRLQRSFTPTSAGGPSTAGPSGGGPSGGGPSSASGAADTPSLDQR
ncbi:unnamed protein product [Fusarium equiseti]|uniref:Uncharacterized protein n=1 Tax=Fusarium equiseti TaxID=61235 RepID=A0A8J2IHU5_FUSEQ|nr:unnamed protein product [Fusarium equiseti]